MPQRFSERIGARPVRDSLQIGSMDEALRNRLWTIIHEFFLRPRQSNQLLEGTGARIFFFAVWHNFLSLPTDTLFLDAARNIQQLREWFFKAQWFQVYDFVEFLANNPPNWVTFDFRKMCNSVLIQEMSAYRFVGDQIGPITDDTEIDAIEQGLAETDVSPWFPVHKHLDAAKGMLFKRENPDFRNSIKESISAVEAAASILAGEQRADLGAALAVLENQGSLHPALKEAFKKLYAYTSDFGGIRHALLEGDSSCGFEDAKYMLVTCSAFVHYLIAKTADR